jgi:hypothetical protein
LQTSQHVRVLTLFDGLTITDFDGSCAAQMSA